MPKAKKLYIGILSGTSMDAIDVAAIDFFSTDQPILIAANNYPINNTIKIQCRSIIAGQKTNLIELGQLNTQLGQIFAASILTFLEQNLLHKNDIVAIGSHGQTLGHYPQIKFPFTLQIGDPNWIQAQTGITTVADFRSRNIAYGGQGAPLAPLLHQELFYTQAQNRAIINLGGIANITLLPTDHSFLTGFDIGPANCLLDSYCQKYLNINYDKNGQISKTGLVEKKLLKLLLQDKYFALKPPKSTGTEYFSIHWLEQKLANFNNLAAADILATVTELSAILIANSIPTNFSVYLCGGGAHNSYLFSRIKNYLAANCQLALTDELGAPVDWLEAMLFAYLAKQRIEANTSLDPKIYGVIYN